jgi:ribosome-binding factor A
MTQRSIRVAHLLVQEVSQVVREELHHRPIGFVTFLRADVTSDLRFAKVFYSVLGSDEEKKQTDLSLQNAAKYIKKLVNDRMGLRYAVELKLIREDNIEHSFEIDKILKRIEDERKEKES